MTDKEKIHKVIEKRYEYWKERELNSHSVESEIRMSECQHLLLMIDSLQEKPKPQFKVGDTIRSKVWDRAVHEIVYMDDSAYFFENGGMVRFADQAQWELAEEPVNDGLEEAAIAYNKKAVTAHNKRVNFVIIGNVPNEHFIAGAKWKENHLWKPADGDDLPEIDREVIALLNSGKVVFAHRPYNGKYIGKSLTTGNIETFENETYDKGGWNQPNVKWWLDCNMDSIFKK